MRAAAASPRIGLPSATALVVANAIGAGVFTSSGFALEALGSQVWVMLAWATGGLLALAGALSYGALARRLPESGGEYHFLSQAVHPLAGFLAGWVSLLAGFTAPIAAAAAALQAYLSPWLGAWIGAPRAEWIGTGAIAITVAMHAIHARGGARLQTAIVALKLAMIAGFIAVGAARLPDLAGGAVAPVPLDLGAFAVTLAWISFSYSGWNAAVYVAAEVEDPRRNVGRAMWIGTVIVVASYLALNAVFVYSAPLDQLAGTPRIGAVAAAALGGELLERAVSAIVAVGLFTSISAMVMAGPRVYARMAEDGLFPRAFAAGAGPPTAAIALQGALAVVVLWRSDLRDLLSYIGFTLSLSAAATVAALLWLRHREGRERMPIAGYPWLQLGFIAATAAIGVFFAQEQPRLFAAGIGTVVAGVPLYFVMRRRSRRAPA